MALVVQKFGGTSLANIAMIRKVALRVINAYDSGNNVVVVLSAMAGVTDNLLQLAYGISASPDKREMDVLLATGEQASVAILAMMLREMGYRAISVLAHQIDINTDSSYGNARILRVSSRNIEKIIQNDFIAIVAGFQGCDKDGNITTLGRGGSDTTAVAVAAALKADICEIYTDVEGVYTADPAICSEAKKLESISYDEMFYMACLGTKVLNQHSISLAKRCNVEIHVRSSFSSESGTMVIEDSFSGQKCCAVGIACDLSYARVTIKRISKSLNITSEILTPIIEANIPVDMLIEDVMPNGHINLSFTVPKSELKRVLEIEKFIFASKGSLDIVESVNNAKISVIGLGMDNQTEIIPTLIKVFKKEGINIIMFDVSSVKISFVIDEKKLGLAVRVLHSVFDLD